MGGRGGQKSPKNHPHGLWMFPNAQGHRNSIISGETAQVKKRTREGNFKKLL